MKDEIKELLDKLNKLEYDDIHLIICEVISRRDIKQLLDYITNLEQENKRLKLELSGYREAILRNDELLGLQDYKFRCEKAIEYIKVGKTFDNEDVRKIVNKIQNDLINILQGSDE